MELSERWFRAHFRTLYPDDYEHIARGYYRDIYFSDHLTCHWNNKYIYWCHNPQFIPENAIWQKMEFPDKATRDQWLEKQLSYLD